MAKKRDAGLTSKIFALKQAGQQTEVIATKLNINPETVRRHVRSTEYLSLAHDMAETYRGNMTEEIQAVHDIVMKVLKMKDSDGNPKAAAIHMAKALAVTQIGRMMSTRAAEKTVDISHEEKKKLLNELMELKERTDGENS